MKSLGSREITEADIVFLTGFISEGLGYDRGYFAIVFDQLRRRDAPSGVPKYGYVLESDGHIVGAILLIFSEIPADTGRAIRCHVTSWYVKPEFRLYAPVFYLKALKHKSVTYINISARPGTLEVIKLQGFTKYSSGQVIAPTPINAVFGSGTHGVEVWPFRPDADLISVKNEHKLLTDHHNFGCIVLCCFVGGEIYPFVFHQRLLKNHIPVAQLIYCRRIEDLAICMRELSKFLVKRGIFAIRIDSNDKIGGVIGTYFDGIEPRYYKGDAPPRLGDLAYTQAVLAPYPISWTGRTIEFEQN